MLSTVHRLAGPLTLSLASLSVALCLGCGGGDATPGSAQGGRAKARGADDQPLVAESLPDDARAADAAERVDPLTGEELAAQLVSDRRPAPRELMFPINTGGPPAPKSAVDRVGVRPLVKEGVQPRVAGQVAAPPGGKIPEAKLPEAKVADAKLPEAKLFDRWPKPKLAIVISGLQNGYLEPCGCAGLENMKGGLMRRHTFLQSLEDPHGLAWPAVVCVDLGNLVGRYGWQAEQKFDTAIRALKAMKYDAIGYGPDDLRLDPGTLVLGAADAGGPFVAANLEITGSDASLTPPYRIIERGGYKIGITGVLGDKFRRDVPAGDIAAKEADKALAAVMPKLAGCHVRILLSHAEMAETKELLKRYPAFDIVVTAGGPDEPPLTEERLPGKNTWIIESGRKGMYLQVIGFFPDDARTPRRFQRVPIDSRFKDSPDVKKLMVSLQKKFEDHYKLGAQQKDKSGWEALGIRPLPHPSGRTFVGSATCGGCHTKAFAIWEKTPHAKATTTLVKAHLADGSELPRTFDAECLSCHVTGWEPQKFFPFKGGYESLAKTPELAHNGCENCHGPGSKHVEIEGSPGDFPAAERTKAQQQMRLTIAQAKATVCSSCHDLDNSPNYIKNGFEAYWPKVEHKGKD